MNLREAAERTLRSITTLRRYIRSGRLRAEKIRGRYGPEYFVTTKDLGDAGLAVEPGEEDNPSRALEKVQPSLPAPSTPETVPLSLYLELQMKHEQLLVQYGMMRASGVRALDLQAEVESKRRELEESKNRVSRLQERLAREAAHGRKRLQESELELEGRSLEIAALREKVRALEMLTRNAVTNESIERQCADLVDQTRRVERSAARDRERHSPRSWLLRKVPSKPPEDH